ncbi:hypothetical protein TNCV_5031911 [Trichonephila clavipes]|nr:hypothetical protein TNCV_5031911 [Trichonephila clavipes]
MVWLVCRWPSVPKVVGSTPAQVDGFSTASMFRKSRSLKGVTCVILRLNPYAKPEFVNLCAKPIYQTATAGSDVVQSGRPIFDDFFQHLWPYIGNNTTNVVFQMVKRLCLIRIDQ